MYRLCLCLLLQPLLCLSTLAKSPDYHSQYAGQESRKIKSLSADDVKQLQQGRGWGLAKAAELNGMPGPIHVLQMKHKIALNKVQEKKVTALYAQMKAEAIPLGKKYIQLELRLNQAFASKTISEDSLRRQLKAIAESRAKLRYAHLRAHLQTSKVLSKKQIALYNKLRGYNKGDPCKNIPQGHNPDMWRKHNGCN